MEPHAAGGPAATRAGPLPFRVVVALFLAGAAVLGGTMGLGAHVLFTASPGAPGAPALPELHGQATWAAGERPAPPFTLHDVLGGRTSLASLRGHPVLVTFLDSRCRSLCPLVGRAIGAVQRSLPAAARPAVLVVSVDPAGDTAASVRSAAHRWRLGPGWRWLSGTPGQLAAVWRAYGIVVEPTSGDITHGASLYLVDARGGERAGYLAPLLPNFIALDVRRVEAEHA
jgi:cytochrome oxidase Cu insertion factor (SCO1/SenC/PrrC family)